MKYILSSVLFSNRMTMRKLPYHFGFISRWYPSQHQRNMIEANSNDARAFYNHLIALDRRLWMIKCTPMYNPAVKQSWLHNLSREKLATWFKHHNAYVNNSIYLDSLALALTTHNHKTAWKNYRDGKQHLPTFHAKKKHPYEDRYQTYASHYKIHNHYTQNAYFLDTKHMMIPKLKKIILAKPARRLIYNKRNDIRIGTITIYKNSLNHYYISFQLASDKPFVHSLKMTNRKVGIDLNLSKFLEGSNGMYVPNPRFYTHTLPRLEKLQQTESRRRRHAKAHHKSLRLCKGYQRARYKVSQLQTRIKMQRKNFLQVNSTRLVENQDLIVAEYLLSSNMLRNHRLAQRIQDVGWKSFIMMLAYKVQLYHKQLILVNKDYTTQRCSCCGYVCNRKDGTHVPLGTEHWYCPNPNCPYHYKPHHRDLNASINILMLSNIKSKIKHSYGNPRVISKMA